MNNTSTQYVRLIIVVETFGHFLLYGLFITNCIVYNGCSIFCYFADNLLRTAASRHFVVGLNKWFSCMQSSCILDHLHVSLKHTYHHDAALACPKVVKLPRLAQHDEPSK